MTYNTKKMLEDINGDLIPQYWDVAAQEFKPLTNDPRDVRLTGSKVELLILNDVEVSVGSEITLVDRLEMDSCKSYTVAFWCPSHISMTIMARRRHGSFFTDNVKREIFKIETSYTGASELIDSTETSLRLVMVNNGDVSITDGRISVIGVV